MDPLSHKIVSELGKDGRISNVKLAKILGVNVLTVSKRVKALKEQGIIEIKAIPNVARMGYHSALFCLNVNQAKMDSVASQLTKIPNIVLLVTCFGRFDILFIAIFPDFGTLQNLVNITIPQIPGINHFNQYLISETKKSHSEMMASIDSGITQSVTLDDIDHKLVNELLQDGHPNYSKLADKLGISTATISRRISILVNEKIITFAAMPNLTKLGFLGSAFVILNTDSKKTDAICKQLSDFQSVYTIGRLMNNNKVSFIVICSDVGELYGLITSKIATIDGVIDSETFVRGPVSYFNTSFFLPPSTNPIDQF